MLDESEIGLAGEETAIGDAIGEDGKAVVIFLRHLG